MLNNNTVCFRDNKQLATTSRSEIEFGATPKIYRELYTPQLAHPRKEQVLIALTIIIWTHPSSRHSQQAGIPCTTLNIRIISTLLRNFRQTSVKLATCILKILAVIFTHLSRTD